MAKYSDKGKILKAAKQVSNLQVKTHKSTRRFFNRNLAGQKIVA